MDIDPGLVVQAKIAFAALCGGVTRLLFKPAADLLKTFWLLFGCVTCGAYFTGPSLRFLSLQPDDAGAVGAALGFAGLSVAQGILAALDRFDFSGFFLNLLSLFHKKKD
jgi:hypothetical protein